MSACDVAAMVREFAEASDAYVADSPGIPPVEVIDLRDFLIEQERDECFEASSQAVGMLEDFRLATELDLIDPPEEDERKVVAHWAHEIADEVIVSFGAALELGVDLYAVIREVHAANMRKVANGVRKDERGKVTKPKGWKPADVYGVLFG